MIKKVVIDAGHGKETAGKRSPIWSDGSQLFEYEFNRDIAKRVWLDLRIKGFDAILLVPEQDDVSLQERCRRVNDICTRNSAKEVLLVSIHANAGKGTGWEIWHYPGSKAGEKYAQIFSDVFDELPYRNRGVKTEKFYILKNARCPALLTENLFMDTETDCRYIMSEEGRAEIARLHVEAILKIIEA